MSYERDYHGTAPVTDDAIPYPLDVFPCAPSEPTPTCDICGEPDGPGEPDWNGDTGNHASCEIAYRAPEEARP